MIGTTRLMTDVSGSVLAGSQSVHTAFGEAIAPNGNHRYGYAGAWGYQSLGPDADPVGYGAPNFLHVGHRYYDPATGRFLQRDPIGIAGGFNVYEYVFSSPTWAVDPMGLDIVGAIQDASVGAVVGGAAGAAYGATSGAIAGSPVGGFGAGPGAVAGGIAGGMVGFCVGYVEAFVGHYVADWVFDRHAPPPPPAPRPPARPIQAPPGAWF